MKLLIAIPTHDYMNVQFVESLTKLIRKLDQDGVDFDISYQSGTLVYVGRDRLAHRAIDKKYTHVLWLDADMVFNDTLLDDLMECGKPFVTGIAHGRRAPFASCIFTKIWASAERWHDWNYPTSPFKIAGCGFACVLIETRILKAVMDAHGSCFFPMRELGEDLTFCKRAGDLGFEIWAEPTAKLGHVGHLVVYPEQQETYQNSVLNFDEVKRC